MLSLVVMATACKSVPHQQLYQAQTATTVKISNDTIHLELDNPLKSPMRYYLSSSDSLFNLRLKAFQPVVMQPETKRSINIPADSLDVKTFLLNTGLGDPATPINRYHISLPFPKGKSYRVIQAYEGTYSHNDAQSKYAIDFNLKVGDTVCAADDGVVVGVIKDYKYGGADKKWSDYANYITIFHPKSGLYTQYVHLKQNGSFVKIGDTVTEGQSIGLAGKTGWTDIAHLHFNVKIAVPQGLLSVPVKFKGGYDGEALQRDDVVKR
jgi:murein DD-endopeptidase MepM/ murein hydrolase activator NlpD